MHHYNSTSPARHQLASHAPNTPACSLTTAPAHDWTPTTASYSAIFDIRSTPVSALTSFTGMKHTHPFNSPLSRTTWLSRYQKGKPIWILLKQETVSGSGISWAICKSAPRSRQITTPEPHHSVFIGQMPLLLPNQQRQNIKVKEKHGNC